MAAALDLPIRAGFAGTDSHQDEPCAARVIEIPSENGIKVSRLGEGPASLFSPGIHKHACRT